VQNRTTFLHANQGESTMRRTVADTTGRRVVEEDVPPAMAARRRGIGRRRVVEVDEERRPGAGAAVATGAGNALVLLARLVRFVTGVLVTIIVAAILLKVLGANQGNSIVSSVTDLGRSLVGPFDGIFHLKDAKVEIAVNWGLAAFAYLVVGSFLASLLARAGLAGARHERV
jgi:hypothetical protein